MLPDPGLLLEAERLAAETKSPVTLWRLLLARGVVDVPSARKFLRPKIQESYDPLLLLGVSEVVARLTQAIEKQELIGIHGDYDVDGLTSTALYTRVLRRLGAKVLPFVPHRMIDGYGVADRAIEMFAESKVKVILTCDTGFSAHGAVRTAVETHGMAVLITDHHLGSGDERPIAEAIVNPHQPGDEYPFKGLCGVGVAFKVLQALCQALDKEERTVLWTELDLVALGTVADVMPLLDENRIFVAEGLKMLRQTRNIGLRAILEKAEVPKEKIHEGTLGWILGPRLNAVGRIDDAGIGLKLLLTEDETEAEELATLIEARNTTRRAMTKAIEMQAVAQLDGIDWPHTWGLALFSPETVAEGEAPWHHGVIGIVASRIVERTGRPTFLFAPDEESGFWKGSGRCPVTSGGHLQLALETLRSEFLVAGGGHAAAAGATLKSGTGDARTEFSAAFNAVIEGQVRNIDALRPIINIEGTVKLADLSEEVFEKFLKPCGPFGQANPDPIWLAQGVEYLGIKFIGKDQLHGRVRLRQEGVAIEALCWRVAELYPWLVKAQGAVRLDCCLQLKEDTWQGKKRLQYELKDCRVATDDPSLGVTAIPPASLFAE